MIWNCVASSPTFNALILLLVHLSAVRGKWQVTIFKDIKASVIKCNCVFLQGFVQNLVTKITTILDTLIVTPDAAELVSRF